MRQQQLDAECARENARLQLLKEQEQAKTDAESAREHARLQLLKEQEQAIIDTDSARDTQMKQLEAHKLQLEADTLQWHKEQDVIRQEQLRADREFQIHLQQEHAAARQHELELAARVEANALRREQFQAQGNRDIVQEDRRNSIVERAKRYGDILKNALPKMP